jgi:hypothetical protein
MWQGAARPWARRSTGEDSIVTRGRFYSRVRHVKRMFIGFFFLTFVFFLFYFMAGSGSPVFLDVQDQHQQG